MEIHASFEIYLVCRILDMVSFKTNDTDQKILHNECKGKERKTVKELVHLSKASLQD